MPIDLDDLPLREMLNQHVSECKTILTKKKLQKERQQRPYRVGVLSYDPAYPYELPRSRMVFKDIPDEINNRGFHAVYPQSFTPIPNYFTQLGIDPYYSPGEDVDYAPGSLTIAGMIELTDLGKPWKLVYADDFAVIISLVEQYVADMAPFANDNPQLLQYLKKCNLFLDRMRDGQDAACKRTDDIKPHVNFAVLFNKIFG